MSPTPGTVEGCSHPTAAWYTFPRKPSLSLSLPLPLSLHPFLPLPLPPSPSRTIGTESVPVSTTPYHAGAEVEISLLLPSASKVDSHLGNWPKVNELEPFAAAIMFHMYEGAGSKLTGVEGVFLYHTNLVQKQAMSLLRCVPGFTL